MFGIHVVSSSLVFLVYEDRHVFVHHVGFSQDFDDVSRESLNKTPQSDPELVMFSKNLGVRFLPGACGHEERKKLIHASEMLLEKETFLRHNI